MLVRPKIVSAVFVCYCDVAMCTYSLTVTIIIIFVNVIKVNIQTSTYC